MASLFSLLSVARDGILAQSGALNVTGQNVAGANTPGFVKRTPIIQSMPGGGVSMAGAARSFDRFTYSQVVEQSGRLSSATARSNALTNVEALVTSTTDHIGDRADALFDALNELAAHPSDMSVRGAVLSKAGWLASAFSETAGALETFRGELGTQALDVASQINERLEALSSLDAGVIAARGRGEDASDLLDRRDLLAKEIGERIGARVIEGPNGGLTLFGGGAVLYEGGNAAKLAVSLDGSGALRIQADRNGNVIDITNGITTGTLAGIKQVRDSDITDVLSSLDSYAKDLTDTINAIHVTGFGLDGSTGNNLFLPSATAQGAAHAMAVDPAMVDHPERLAAAGTVGDIPGGNDVASQLAQLARRPINGGSTSSERFASIASNVGVLRTSAASEEQMRQDTVATATALNESASGVSTDEEMIHLQQFQRAFEASTRVLRTIDALFDSLMSAIG